LNFYIELLCVFFRRLSVLSVCVWRTSGRCLSARRVLSYHIISRLVALDNRRDICSVHVSPADGPKSSKRVARSPAVRI